MVAVTTLGEVPVRSRVVLDTPHLEAAQTRRLAELGLRAGSEVTVLHRTAGGGRVIAVDDIRIAVDRGTLRGLPVRPSPPEGPRA